MNLATILALLPKVGPVIAALPEFKALVEQIIATLASDRDQAELQAAYEAATDDAADAHARLQAIVARHA